MDYLVYYSTNIIVSLHEADDRNKDLVQSGIDRMSCLVAPIVRRFKGSCDTGTNKDMSGTPASKASVAVGIIETYQPPTPEGGGFCP